MAALRDRLEAGLKAATPEAVIFGEDAPRLPNTTLFAVPGMKAETGDNRLRSQRDSGVVGFRLFVRQGARLARAGGHGRGPALARGAVRVSIGPTTTEADDRTLPGKLGLCCRRSLLKERRGIAA